MFDTGGRLTCLPMSSGPSRWPGNPLMLQGKWLDPNHEPSSLEVLQTGMLLFGMRSNDPRAWLVNGTVYGMGLPHYHCWVIIVNGNFHSSSCWFSLTGIPVCCRTTILCLKLIYHCLKILRPEIVSPLYIL